MIKIISIFCLTIFSFFQLTFLAKAAPFDEFGGDPYFDTDTGSFNYTDSSYTATDSLDNAIAYENILGVPTDEQHSADYWDSIVSNNADDLDAAYNAGFTDIYNPGVINVANPGSDTYGMYYDASGGYYYNSSAGDVFGYTQSSNVYNLTDNMSYFEVDPNVAATMQADLSNIANDTVDGQSNSISITPSSSFGEALNVAQGVFGPSGYSISDLGNNTILAYKNGVLAGQFTGIIDSQTGKFVGLQSNPLDINKINDFSTNAISALNAGGGKIGQQALNSLLQKVGGKLDLDKSGKPTGIVRDAANNIIGNLALTKDANGNVNGANAVKGIARTSLGPGGPSSGGKGESEFFPGATNLTTYLPLVYKWALGIAAGLAILMLTWAGFSYATSEGNPDKINEAKEVIVGAISGLVFLMLAYLILQALGVTS